MAQHPDLGDPEVNVFLNHTLAKQEQEKAEHDHDVKYPEHAKLRPVADESQKLGCFLDWLLNAHKPEFFLCTRETHHGRGDMTYSHAAYSIEELLAEYFEIDHKKLSDEKDKMVEELHANFTPPGQRK